MLVFEGVKAEDKQWQIHLEASVLVKREKEREFN